MDVRRRLTGLAIVLIAAGLPATGLAEVDSRSRPVDGARSLGDPLLPQLGNGGYDAWHYTIELDYDPVSQPLRRGDDDHRRCRLGHTA